MNTLVLKISDYLLTFNLVNRLERVNKILFVFILLGLIFLTFNLSGNEEQYMLYAKQYMDPSWIMAESLNEFAGTRLIYQIIIGWFLKYFSFEWVLFFFKFILCFLFAHALAKIYRQLKITNVQVLLHLPILFLTKQSLFADSWMLVSVEPKSFAWLFVLYALYYFIKQDYLKMVGFLLLGTYFHILVGGYAFLFLMMTIFLFNRPKRNLDFIKLIFIYGLLILPFVIYLKTAVSSKVVYTPSVDWIYSYYRHPHHIGLFKDLGYFYSKHFMGVFLSVIALVYSLLFYRINKKSDLNRLNQFVLVSLFGVLIAVIIAFFDNEGVIIKYYPFRINTLTTFVLTLILTSFLYTSVKRKYLSMYSIVIVLISCIFIIKLAKPNLNSVYTFLTKSDTNAIEKLSTYVKTKTNNDAVVLNFTGDFSLTRRFERDPFVEYKFIPAVMNAIPNWYERVLYKKALMQDIHVLKEEKFSYKIDYILARKYIDTDFVELVYSDNDYYLYKVNFD